MVNDYVYPLPTWPNAPIWWRNFINEVFDRHPACTSRELKAFMESHLGDWHIKRVKDDLVCDSQETFMQFVLAYS